MVQQYNMLRVRILPECSQGSNSKGMWRIIAVYFLLYYRKEEILSTLLLHVGSTILVVMSLLLSF